MSPNPQTIHKQGYLFKQGVFLPTWNERYFSLETSLFKQFTDAETPIPSYSLYLGSAAVSGVFSAAENESLGYGLFWSFVVRWPLPSSPDVVEEQWGYMHIGSYEKTEADEWFDSIEALIKVEQTKKIMFSASCFREAQIRTPPDFLPIPPGNSVTKLSCSNQIIPDGFSDAYSILARVFNQDISRWQLKDVSNGLLRQLKESPNIWKFSVSIPSQKVWETLISSQVAEWEPLVKNASANIENSTLLPHDVISDEWAMLAQLRGRDCRLRLKRVGFRDDKSGIYILIGVPVVDANNSPAPPVVSLAWTVEKVNESNTILSIFITLAVVDQNLVEAVIRPSVIRVREFILSQ